MSEEDYNLADILDKKDFAVYLNEEVIIDEPFFTEEATVITSYLDRDVLGEELPPTEESTRDLTSENFKGIIHVPDSYFHYFSDFVGPIVVFLEECIEKGVEKVEVISVVVEPAQPVVQNFTPFLTYCLSQFSDRIEIIQTQINENQRLSDFEKAFIKINKFRVIDQRDIGISIESIYEMAKTFSEHSDSVVPGKKVFISRRNDSIKDSSENRELYEEDVENFFTSIGFEVISGESFEGLKEQIKYFDDVSVFAGYTGAGMTSSMFMKPKQTVIEIVCPLKFDNGLRYEIHNFYKTISMLKKHKYVGIPNINNSKEDLLLQLQAVANIL
jgi:hypothetical protein